MRRGDSVERYLERLAAARSAIGDLAVTTDIIVGFPGETEADFEDTLSVAAEAAFDSAYTFIFSARPGTRAADMEKDFIEPEVIAQRFDRLKTVVERSALAKHQARVGRVEEVLVEGTSRRDDSMLTGRTRQGKLVHFADAAPGLRSSPRTRFVAEVTVTAGHPHHLSGELGRVTAPEAPHTDPGGQRLSAVALVGVTASGKSHAARAVARRRGDTEIVSVDSMCVYRGMDLGTAKPTLVEQAEVPHHLIDLVDPDTEFTVREFQRAAEVALRDIAERGRHGLLVGGTGLYLRSVIDQLEIPGRYPDVVAALDAELDAAGDDGGRTIATLHARLGDLDPVAADRMEPNNRRRIVRALEVTIGSGRPFSSFGPGLETYPPSRFVMIGIAIEPEIGGSPD